MNSLGWAMMLPLQEVGVLHPPPGQRPAREYFFGYRLTVFDRRRLYRKEEHDRVVYVTPDVDGGKSMVTIDKASNKRTYESYAPDQTPRPMPVDSEKFLNKYVH